MFQVTEKDTQAFEIAASQLKVRPDLAAKALGEKGGLARAAKVTSEQR